MKKLVTFSLLALFSLTMHAQNELSELFSDLDSDIKNLPVTGTFKSDRAVNSQTVETTHKEDLVFEVIHRFGDLAGDHGGFDTFYGLDNSTDIQIGFKYGISDQWNVGFGRTKGSPNGLSTFQRQLLWLDTKYRFLQQSGDDRTPVSASFYANAVISAMKKLEAGSTDASFDGFGDRTSYVAQLIVARKFSPGFSVQIAPTYIRRNSVSEMEQNDLFALGVVARMKVSKRMAIVVDYYHNFRSNESRDYFKDQQDFRFYDPLGIGLEIETGGHVFNLSFTNSTAILESQYIPSTSSSWESGEFRWGFSISRTFSLKKKDGVEAY